MFDRVRSFIAQYCAIAPESIKPDSTLFADLGIAGDDGVEFILEFSRRFGVDICGMNVGEYFGDEGFSLAFWRSRRLVPIAVEELVAAARSKRW